MTEQKKLCPEYQLHRRLQKQMREVIKEFSLIQQGDRILIGLSGGKDSLLARPLRRAYGTQQSLLQR